MAARQKVLLIVLGGVLALGALLCGVCRRTFTPLQSNTQWLTQNYYLLRRSSGVSIGAQWTDPGYIIVVAPDVIDLDWNEEFIVIRQNPKERPGVPDMGVTSWYIVDVASYEPLASNLEPLSYDEYLEMRRTLSVPGELGLLEPEQEPWEAYEHRQTEDN